METTLIAASGKTVYKQSADIMPSLPSKLKDGSERLCLGRLLIISEETASEGVPYNT